MRLAQQVAAVWHPEMKGSGNRAGFGGIGGGLLNLPSHPGAGASEEALLEYGRKIAHKYREWLVEKLGEDGRRGSKKLEFLLKLFLLFTQY